MIIFNVLHCFVFTVICSFNEHTTVSFSPAFLYAQVRYRETTL